MPIKFNYEAETDIPAPLLEFYDENDGVWTLSVEGGHSDKDFGDIRALLDKERKNHRQSKQRLDKFGDLTPEDATTLREEITELQAQIDDHKDSEDVDKLAEEKAARQVEKMRKNHETAIKALIEQSGLKDQEITGLKSERDRSSIRNELNKAVSKLTWAEGLDDTREHIVNIGLQSFKYVDGGLVKFRDDDPEAIEYSAKDGTKPLSPAEWIGDWAAGHPKYFAPNVRGADARGGDSRNAIDPRSLSHLPPAERIAKDRERNAR